MMQPKVVNSKSHIASEARGAWRGKAVRTLNSSSGMASTNRFASVLSSRSERGGDIHLEKPTLLQSLNFI